MNELWNNLNGTPKKHNTGEIGVVTRGSLTEGVEMKLNPDRSVEDVKAGKFVVIQGYKNQFFSMITDLSLDATNPEILLYPPHDGDQLLHSVLNGSSTYVTVALRPMLKVTLREHTVLEGFARGSRSVGASEVREDRLAGLRGLGFGRGEVGDPTPTGEPGLGLHLGERRYHLALVERPLRVHALGEQDGSECVEREAPHRGLLHVG